MAFFGCVVPAGLSTPVPVQAGETVTLTHVSRTAPGEEPCTLSLIVNGFQFVLGTVTDTPMLQLSMVMSQNFTLVNSGPVSLSVMGTRAAAAPPPSAAQAVAFAPSVPKEALDTDASYASDMEPLGMASADSTPAKPVRPRISGSPGTPDRHELSPMAASGSFGASGGATSGADEDYDQMMEANRRMITKAWAEVEDKGLRKDLLCQAKKHKKQDEAEYQEAFKEAQRAGHFSDPVFEASKKSLCFNAAQRQEGARATEDVSDTWKAVVWKRPREFLDAKLDRPTLFDNAKGKVQPNDIQQGEIGDCYFLSSLSVLAEQEDRIQFLFFKEKLSDHKLSGVATAAADMYKAKVQKIAEKNNNVDLGLFAVRLCIQGHWRQIILSDEIPCYPDVDADAQSQRQVGGPIFSRGKGCELWVTLLEKAWAKVFGSYQHIIWGLPGECLTNLTGAPCQFVPTDPKNSDKVWETIHQAVSSANHGRNARGWFVVALMPEDAEEDLKMTVGLILGHAYGVLDTVRLNGTPLIQLRNPWGNLEWKGAWSDNDAHWTPSARAELKKLSRVSNDKLGLDDGTFWMCAADFCQYFAGVQICRASHGWKHTSETIRVKADTISVLMLTVTVRTAHTRQLAATRSDKGTGPVCMDVTVHQEDRRFYFEDERYNHATFRYLGARMLVVRAETCEIVGQRPLTNERDVWVEVNDLEQGKYWVLIESDWDGSDCLMAKEGGALEFGVSCVYDPSKGGRVELLAPTHCTPPINGDILKRLAFRAACENVAEENVSRYGSIFTDCPEANGIVKKYYAGADADAYAWLYRNSSTSLKLCETLTFTLRNLYVDNLRYDSLSAAREAMQSTPPTALTAAPAGPANGQLPPADNPSRTVTVSIELAPGATELIILRQVKGGELLSYSTKVSVDLEDV